MCYQLPKIWMGRIQKYWEKFIPKGYPISSSIFSLKYDTPEIKEAVDEMEKTIGTEDSPIKDIIPEGTFISKYYGVYNVTGTPDELTLLSPQKVEEDNNILVSHYNSEENKWESIDDIEIKDGYIWGTLESFSPIAVFKYNKEMHIETTITGIDPSKCENFIVCEGNPIKISYDNDTVLVTNEGSGKQIEVSTKTYIIGGSIDGTPVEKTNITILNQPSSDVIYKIIAGSVYNVTDGTCTTVDSINIYMNDSIIYGLTGSMGAVRTNEVNYNINNSTAEYFIGSGECFAGVNTPPSSFASKGWIKKANLKFTNIECQLLFIAGNNEYLYVDDTSAVIDNCNINYLTSGGSNDGTRSANIVCTNSTIDVYQTTNRGNVVDSKAKFTGCTVNNLYIGGESTDTTVTGTTKNISIEINAGEGSYNIVPGTNGGELITKDIAKEIINYIKVSRNTTIIISEDFKSILGNKYIVK